MAGSKRPANNRSQTSTRPHMEVGQKGQDTKRSTLGPAPGPTPGPGPRANVPPMGQGLGQGQGPRPNPQGQPPNRGSEAWLKKHPNGPMAQHGTKPGGMPQPPVAGFDYDAFNAWQDPTIGGQQPGPIQQGWGGVGALDSMTQTKMNNYLNMQSIGGDRERMMNALGYNNGGNPYTPQVPRGTNQFYNQAAKSGDYTSPGIYQHQTAGASAGNIGTFGGYTGYTTVGEDGSGQYTPFDINKATGRRRSTQIGGGIY